MEKAKIIPINIDDMADSAGESFNITSFDTSIKVPVSGIVCLGLGIGIGAFLLYNMIKGK